MCRKAVRCLLVILAFLDHQVESQETCSNPRATNWPRNCPDLDNGVRKNAPSTSEIGGLFSVSRWIATEQLCTICSPGEPPVANRFAVEQVEAMIYASELVSRMVSLGYQIVDTCGNHADGSECPSRQAGQLNGAGTGGPFATIIGPYYSGNSASLTNAEMRDLFEAAGGQLPRSGKGVLSLIDEPYPDPSTFADDPGLSLGQVFMLQQSCDLQAAAVVDFIIQERWVDLTVVGSGDDCGGLSLQLVHETLKDRELDCHFKVC